jgi:RNA 2',3'-cyclic 3'-phosphodiesterase
VTELGRGFLAVVPPDAVLDAIEVPAGEVETSGQVPEGARRTTRPQWHLTLQFLGNRTDFDAVGDGLGALAVGRGTVRLGGVGAFPSERRGRVLWLGVHEGAAFLAQLAAAVGALLAPVGYPPDDRPFHPHVTLARLKRAGDLRPTVAALGSDPVGPPWVVGEVVLFQSRTRSSGAHYVERARFGLGR